MKRGIEITQVYIQSHTDTTRTAVKITKKRGKLTLDEIEDLLRYENGQSWCGHYIILLNCSEATLEGSSWFVEEEPKGDVVYLHKIEGDDSCPVWTAHSALRLLPQLWNYMERQQPGH